MSRNLSILLIEDDRLIQCAMSEGLIYAGHLVTIAGTAHAALDVLATQPHFDVILLDLRLEADRGEDIFIELRERGIAFAPVVIVSAQPEAEIRDAAARIPAANSLRKPVSITEICDAMERAVA